MTDFSDHFCHKNSQIAHNHYIHFPPHNWGDWGLTHLIPSLNYHTSRMVDKLSHMVSGQESPKPQ